MGGLDFIPQSRICIICKSDRLKRFWARASDSNNKDQVSIVECKDCTFAWQYPLARSKAESAQFFESAYHAAEQSQDSYFEPERKRQIAKLQLDFIEQFRTGQNRLLEIGAGACFFAESAAEKGWIVTAVDPCLEVSRLHGGQTIECIRGTPGDIPDERLFDVVTMWDVVEHVTDPLDLVLTAKDLLAEGGWVVIETGNYKSVDRIIDGREHWIYKFDHRWYFSPDSISHLLRSVGFNKFVFSERVFRPNWEGASEYCGPRPINSLKALTRHPLQFRHVVSNYNELVRAKSWPMSGLSIMTLAGQKPVAPRQC
jgi:SAM-dependent methyltransferase